MRPNGPRLLPGDAVVDTGGTQHADWSYRPVLGGVMRRRHELALSLLPTRAGRLVELGYGSGLLMPELATRCEELHGVDLHGQARAVEAALDRYGVTATLCTGDARAMPYRDGAFDCAVAESVLAHVDGLDAACAELHRVLRPDGVLVAVVPGHSVFVDAGLVLLTHARPATDFADRRDTVIPTLLRRFDVEMRTTLPRHGGRSLRLYTGLRLRPRG
jgi:SAM-dependent methyltransferase